VTYVNLRFGLTQVENKKKIPFLDFCVLYSDLRLKIKFLRNKNRIFSLGKRIYSRIIDSEADK
jgi:hypothetical protein